MIASFLSAEGGVSDPYAEKPADTENRSLGTTAVDTLARAAATPVSWMRSATNLARSAEESIRGGPATIMEPVDKFFGKAQQYLEHDVQSPRSQAINTNKWDPKYGERSAWSEPVTTAVHGAIPMLPDIALAAATGGGSLLAKAGLSAAYGAIGAGEAANKVRDFADNTSLEDLRKVPLFQDLMREFNGDERAARSMLYRKSIDLVSELTNAGANMLEFGALQKFMVGRGATQRPVADAIGRVAFGTGTGLVTGGAEGAAAAYGDQRTKVRTGQQQAIDTGPILEETVQSALGMAPVMGVLSGARGERKTADAQTPPLPAPSPPATPSPIPPGGLDPGVADAANQALNGAAAPAAGGGGPAVPVGSGGALGEQGRGAGVWSQAQPGLRPTDPASPTAPAAAPAAPAAVPAQAIDTGQPPLQAQQPAVSVTPPPGRTRTPPVTPAETPPAAAAAPAPAAPVAPATSTGLENLGEMGTAITGNLYSGLYNALANRQTTFAGIRDPILLNPEVRNAFKAGVINSPETLQKFVNERNIAGARPAAPAAPAPAPVAPAVPAASEVVSVLAPAPAPVAPAATGGTEPGAKGKAKVAEVKAKKEKAKAAPAAPAAVSEVSALAPAAKAVTPEVKKEVTKAPKAPKAPKVPKLPKEKTAKQKLAAELATTKDAKLKTTLRKVTHPKPSFDALQDAADYGRANNRADIVALASERADALVAEAKAKKPMREYKKGSERVEVQDALKKNAAAAAARAEEVKTGSRPKAPEPEEAAPRKPKAKLETKAEDKAEEPAEKAKVFTADHNAARTLKRDDVVTTANGTKYKVIDVARRTYYPEDPYVTIHIEGAENYEQHRASELDAERHATSIERAPETKLTRSGKPRMRSEETRLVPGKRVKDDSRMPLAGKYKDYEFVGLNEAGHELWESPDAKNPLRVAKRLVKSDSGRPLRTVLNREWPQSSAEAGRYKRPKDFLTRAELKTQAQEQLPRVIHRVWQGKSETHKRAESPRAELLKSINDRLELLDTEINTGVHERRNRERPWDKLADMLAGPKFAGIPAPVPGVVANVSRRALPDPAHPLREEAYAEGQLIADIRQFHRDIEKVKGKFEITGPGETGSLTRGVHVVDTLSTMGDAEFNQRRAALKQRIIQNATDQVMESYAQRQDTTDAPPLAEVHDAIEQTARDLIEALPAKRVKPEHRPATPAEFNKQVAVLEGLRKLPYRAFFLDKRVLDAIGELHRINSIRMATGPELPPLLRGIGGQPDNAMVRHMASMRGEQYTPLTPLPWPQWLVDKMQSTPMAKEPDSLIQTSYKAAMEMAATQKAVKAKSPSPAAIKRMQAANEKAKKAWEAKVARLEREARIEGGPLEITPAFRKRVADLLRAAGIKKKADVAIAEAEAKLEAEQVKTDESSTSRTKKTKERMQAEREQVINDAIVDTFYDHFDGKAENLTSFLDNLVGQVTIHSVIDRKTNERITVWLPAQYPTPPAALVRHYKRKSSGGATPDNKKLSLKEIAALNRDLGTDYAVTGETPMTREGGARIRRLNTKYIAEVERWKASVQKQLNSKDQLRVLLEDTVARINKNLAEFKKEKGYKGESVVWRLPLGKPGKGGYTRYSAGVANKLFQYYNIGNDMQKVLNRLVVDTEGLHAGRFKRGRDDDIATETRRYMRSLSPTLQNFAVDMKSLFSNNLESINADRAMRSSAIAADFNISDTTRVNEEGQRVTAYESMIDSGAAQSATMQSDPDDGVASVGDSIVQDFIASTQKTDTGKLPSPKQIEDTIDRELIKAREKQGLADDQRTPEELARISKLNAEFPLKSSLVKFRRGMVFDDRGLPVDGKRHVEFEPYIEDEVDVAFAALMSADPTHPSIEPPMTAAQSLSTVAELVVKGQQGDTISKAITPRFLRRLARINEGVTVIHAPYEVVSGAGTQSSAYYSNKYDRVVVTGDGTNEYFTRATVHEHVHAMLYRLLETDPSLRTHVDQLLERTRRRVVRDGIVPADFDFEFNASPSQPDAKLPKHLLGLQDAHEFTSEAKANEKFRQYLARVDSGHMPTIGDKVRNAINALYAVLQRAFHKVMGRTDGDTALDVLFYDQSNVLGKTDDVLSRTMGDLERGVRKRTGPVIEDGAIVNLPDAVDRSHSRNLRGYAGRTVAEARDAVDVRQSRARLLGGHTLFDLGRRTSDPEFQTRVHNITKLKGKVDHKRRVILHEEDGPIIERIGTYLRGLSPAAREVAANAMIVETEHRAFLDASLGERDEKGKLVGRNSHIDPKDLANAQTVADHEWLRANVFAPATKFPGFIKMRNEAHEFYRNKEKAIQSTFIRNIVDAYGMLPRDMSAADYNVAAAALEKHVLSSKAQGTMNEAEKAAMDELGINDKGEKGEQFKEKIADVRQLLREYSHAAGPYLPLVRHGDFAVIGKYILPKADGGEIVMRKDRRPGPGRRDNEEKLVDANIRVFKTPEALHAYERKVSKELGIAQIDGGEWYYDPTTNERIMRYTPGELAAQNKLRAEKGEKPLQNKRATKGDLEEMRAEGRPLETRYWIEFSPHHYSRHDGRTDARAEVAELRKTKGASLQVSDPIQARQGTGAHSEQHVSDTLQKVINSLTSSPEYSNLDKHQRADVGNRLRFIAQKAVMHRGVRQRYQPRKYVRGATHDIVRAASDYSSTTSAWLAKMEFAPQISEAWRDLDDYTHSVRYEAGNRSHEARERIRDYIGERLHEDSDAMAEGLWAKSADRIIRWTMLDKLPGVAYFATNGTEPIVLTAPLMMGRHGVGTTISKIREAYSIFGPLRMLGGGVADMVKAALGGKPARNYRKEFEDRIRGHKRALGLADLVKYLGEHGLYDQHSGMEYQQLARQADTGILAPLDSFAEYLTRSFQGMNVSIENLNRMVSGSAAYLAEVERLERANDPEAHSKALHYAWEIVNKASGVYNNYNAPAWFNKSPLHRLAFEFKKYPQRIIANWIEAAVGAAKGDKEKMRQLVSMLVVQGSVAGVLGLPTEVFSMTVNALFMAGLSDENWEDKKLKFRNWAAEQFGKDAGDMISYGALRATGIDFQSRLSQSDLVFFGSPQSQKVQDMRGAALGILMGAGGGWLADMVTAVQKGAESYHAYESGNATLGLKLAREAARLGLPFRALTDFIDSQNQSDPAGMETASGRRRGAPLDVDEQVVRALGFNPVRVSEQQEKSRALTRLTTRHNAERKRFITEFTTASPSEQVLVWARIQKWNEDLPLEQKLTYDQLRRAAVTRGKAQSQPLDYAGVALDKRGRSFMPQLEF